MASSPKCISILLLVALIFSTQVFARDSQFFSKVPNNNVNNDKETTTHVNEKDEDPLFVPESETGGYALYGHGSGQLPPSTTEPTTYEPYTTVATGYVPSQQKTPTDQFSQETYSNNNNNNYYNRDTYDANHPQENNMAQTSFAEETYTTNNNNNNYRENQYENNNNNNIDNYRENQYENNNNYRENQYENNNNNYQYENKNNKQYTTERQGMSDTRFLENGKYHYDLKNENQKQGMSDTRFMENGKYFYDVKNENTNGNYNYNPNQYPQNSYTSNGRGGYNGNNNNGNTYEYRNNNNNNMAEFQNAEVDEDNFNDEQFEP